MQEGLKAVREKAGFLEAQLRGQLLRVRCGRRGAALKLAHVVLNGHLQEALISINQHFQRD